jgi:hypothetical protein
VLGSDFFGVSPTSFSDCAFSMYSLEPNLCSSAGSFMTRTSLWWRSLKIDGFSGRLLQREAPDEARVYSLYALVPVTAFSRPRFRLVSVWVFCLFFCSQSAFVMLNCYCTICWHSG